MARGVFDSIRSGLLAVLVHLAFLALLLFSLDWTPKITGGSPQPEVVQAVAVDEQKVRKELQQLQSQEQRKRHAIRGHSSSSTWWLVIERHSSTGMISVKTNTSL